MTQGDSEPTAFPSIEPLRPRSMLFTLYGDYAYPRGQAIGLRGLVTIGARLGIGQTAVRSAVARLSRQDWLEARKAGNRSSYRLTEAGRRLIDEGTRRIYKPRRRPWDGRWSLLTYSIPEARRAARDPPDSCSNRPRRHGWRSGHSGIRPAWGRRRFPPGPAPGLTSRRLKMPACSHRRSATGWISRCCRNNPTPFPPAPKLI